MSERILFVDDEKFVLETFRRNLRRHFEVETAEGPTSALKQFENNGPFAVVVSDLKMPVMNGVELLGTIKTRWPDTIRIMLTGQADLQTAVSAVNQGAIFRFLTKPCAPDALLQAVNDGLNQYRLVMAERQLLHGTLRGCIQVLSELLALANPIAFRRSEKGKALVTDIAQVLGLEGSWKFELAAMLCQIGCISLPKEIMERKVSGQPLPPDEEKIFRMHPEIAGNLLRNIPRLEGVVDIVIGQELPLIKEPCIGARILKAVLDFVDMEAQGKDVDAALDLMRTQTGFYDAKVVAALTEVLGRRHESEIRSLEIKDLREGMVLVEPVLSGQGAIMMDRGQTITQSALERFRNFGTILGIREPIYALVKKEKE